MKNFTTNIILLTFRSDFIAKVNFKIALETINNYQDVRLIVGYGGDDITHYNWLNSFKSEQLDCKSFELIKEASPSERFKWALNFPSQWIIFISDDDLINSNYLGVFIDEILYADKTISNIFPKYYGLNIGSEVNHIKLHEIIDLNLFDRTQSYINGPNAGIRYYSAHRVGDIKNIIDENYNLNYFPSYLDQLLTLSSVINGKSISCKHPNTLTYNLDNWINNESCIISDSKFYNKKELVFYHEILWMIDYVNILYPHYQEKYQQQWLISYSLKRINDSLDNFMPRFNLILVEVPLAQLILEMINKILVEVTDCSNVEELLIILNNFKKAIIYN